MKARIKYGLLLVFLAFGINAGDLKTVPELSQMFQRVSINEIPGSREWQNAIEAARQKLESMDLKGNDPIKGIFSSIQSLGLLVGMKTLEMSNTKSDVQFLLKEQKKLEEKFNKKATFGSKVKGFFNKNKKKEYDDFKMLLQGAFDLLKAKIALLQKENN